MKQLTITVTEAHIAESLRRWALEEYVASRDRATALALQEALEAHGVTDDVRVCVYDEEPARIFIGDCFCRAPGVVDRHERAGTVGVYDFTLFAEETWAVHVSHDTVLGALRDD